MIVMLTLIIPILQPKKAQAAAAVPLTQAGISLIEIVLGAVGGQYLINKAFDMPYGDLDAMYQDFYNSLPTSKQAEFTVALATYEQTKIITADMVDKLQLAYLSYMGYSLLQETYNTYTPLTATDYNQLDAAHSSGAVQTKKYVQYQNLLFMVVDIADTGGNVGTFSAISGVTWNNTTNKPTITIKPAITSGYINFYTYFKVIGQSAIQSGGNYTNSNNLFPILMSNNIGASVGTLSPAFDPSIDTEDVPGEVTIPIDTVQTIPAYPIPANPADSVAINIPIPVVGNPAVTIPVATTAPAVPIYGEPDPAVPVVGALNPTLPGDGEGLDFTPLITTGLSEKFPFCIPFDLANVLNVFSDTNRVAPVFNVELAYGMPLNIDLSLFNTVAAVSRAFEIILLTIGLAILTKEVIF